MKSTSMLMALAALSLAGCASVADSTGVGAPANKSPEQQAVPAAGAAPASPGMQGMDEMHSKMQAATTPQERAALMNEHMKAMPMSGQLQQPMPGMQGSGESMPGARMSDADARSFGQQLQAMQEMHRKMQAARSPGERAGLRAEHMKAMRGGMAMMGKMKGMMPKPGSPAGMMPAQHELMMHRMDLMETMMQMMMDREAVKPAPRRRK